MALTIRQITEDQKELAKKLSGRGASSAAVTACIELADHYKRMSERQSQEIRDLTERLRHIESVQERLANACDQALTIVRQRDWVSQ